MTADLEIRGLHVERNRRPVVKGIDIDVPRGQVTALLGPNGAGKSTLVLGITGLLPTSRGTVEINGVDVAGKRADHVRTAGLAAVPEGHRVLTQLTVYDNLVAARGSRMRGEATTDIESILEVFPELESLSDRFGGNLSGGQQQMLAIAQALIANPTTLVIDEMSLGLAPVIVQRLMTVVTEIAQRGIGILLIEQYANLALGVSEHAYVMHKGHISYSGAARELVEQPELLHDAYFGTST